MVFFSKPDPSPQCSKFLSYLSVDGLTLTLSSLRKSFFVFDIIKAMNDLYDQAVHANANGTLTDWLINYLKESGRNEILADGLSTEGLYHTGLINYPIGKYEILMGPDRSFRYYEEPEKYNKRIIAMVESLQQGWKPVPLIATDIWNKGLELNDGTHRAAALLKTGHLSYPTVFYFKTQKAVDDFVRSL